VDLASTGKIEVGKPRKPLRIETNSQEKHLLHRLVKEVWTIITAYA
jgi:hypothetical protein